MGAEQSKSYEGSPELLEARDLASVAKYMKSSRCKNVFTMVSNRSFDMRSDLDVPCLSDTTHGLMTSLPVRSR